ncbi:F0F1 ATP synthase subunit B [Rhodopirellula sp. MGV]|uniref:F0F1 ATP synthase subunit B n=1 Tax=Rhodopirellula sp. MGV TaxID=2023130 RepID=UPI000B96B6F5|nr:F0F1 ATP synthase subunit B [Rhodopirellula sp. MGV]OYP34705.1 ATP synthase F0 subunit B [Rhodopirellula sp. MGV]PNY34340.1 ATP synthase F0 subunit B [Rhodopirellula baltica]
MSMLKTLLLACVLVLTVPASNFASAADETEAGQAQATETHGTVEGDEVHADAEGEHDEAGHGGHDSSQMPPILSFDPGAAVANLAIFLGVFLILAKFVWPVILGGLKAREDKIHSDLHQAQEANEKAQQILADYEKKVAEASAEAQTILADARKDAQSNATRIVDEAKAEAARQSERAQADIETAKKVALAEIADQTSAVAMSVAKQVVGRELQPSDHADLIRNALDQIPSKN